MDVLEACFRPACDLRLAGGIEPICSDVLRPEGVSVVLLYVFNGFPAIESGTPSAV